MDTVAVVSKPKSALGKIHWKSGPSIKQAFPFRDNLMYYISLNSTSAKAYNKMIQCCKFFFQVNPILVIQQMFEPLGDYKISGKTRICSNQHPVSSPVIDECCDHIDLRKTSSKIWLLGFFLIEGNDNPNFTSLLRQKIYRCDILQLVLADATISFDDFKLLTQSVKEIQLVIVNVSDGKPVLLNKLLEVCPKIEKIRCNFRDTSMLVASTLKDISKLSNLENLKVFEMDNIPEVFSFQDVFDFVTKSFLDAKILFMFHEAISDEYKSQLDLIYHELYESKIGEKHYVSYYFDE